MKLMLKPTLAAAACLTMLLALAACNPAASPGPATDAAATPGPIGNASTGPTVIPVNQQIERDGITVGVRDLTLSGQETLVSYWYDCVPREPLLYMRGSKLVVDERQVLEDTGGGGGSGCDSSETKQLEFAAVPADVETLSFQHGPFWGSGSGELVLEIPIGGQLSGLESSFGGEVDLDIVAEFEGLAYRFIGLSAGVDRFSLEYQPASEEAKWRPLTGPLTALFIEDDRGNEFVGAPSRIRWDSENEFAFKQERIAFEGTIDTDASVWRLRVSRPGRVFRGPWHFVIDVPPREASALAAPTTVPEPTATAIPRTTLAPRATPMPDLEPSRLQQAFATIPLELADNLVLFADYDGSRVATGLEEFRGPKRPQEIFRGRLDRLYEGVPLPDSLRDYSGMLRDLVGLNLLGMDLGVWSLESPASSPSFLLMQGVLDKEEIAGKLLDLDYKTDEYGGTVYYRLAEDFSASIRHPLRQLGRPLNRIVLVDDWFVAAPSTAIVEKLIALQGENDASLLDSRPHRLLAEAIGDGLLGAAFMTPEWIVEKWNMRTEDSAALLARYQEDPDRWEPLSPYTLAVLGYRVREDSEEIVMALYYPDPDAADRDTGELEKRWSSFHYDFTGRREALVPVTGSCSPFSTTVVQLESSSVLVGACSVVRNVDRDLTLVGPLLWKWLFDRIELQFLAQDLDKLETAGLQR